MCLRCSEFVHLKQSCTGLLTGLTTTRRGLSACAELQAVNTEQMVCPTCVGTGLWHKGGRLRQASGRWPCSLRPVFEKYHCSVSGC